MTRFKVLTAKSLLSGTALCLCLGLAWPVMAQSSSLDVRILQLLVDEGVIPYAKAQDILTEARAQEQKARQEEAEKKTAEVIDVPYVPEAVRKQIKDEVRTEVMAEAKSQGWIAPNVLPDWVQRIRVSGDFRARYQNEDVPNSVIRSGYLVEGNFHQFPDVAAINKAGGVLSQNIPYLNSIHDRSRANYRARLKFEAEINDYVGVGVRIASGDDTSPVSTNSSFGEHFYKDALWLDQAYVTVKPIDGLEVVAGRMPNPFWSTDLVWDADINPEGIAASYRYDYNEAFNPFGTAAVLPLQERRRSEISGGGYKDSYVYAAQLGAEGRFAEDFRYKAALGYYEFTNLQSEKDIPSTSAEVVNRGGTDWTAPKYLSKGNSIFNVRNDGERTMLAGLASRYELVTLTGKLTYGTGPRQYSLTAEVVKNQGMDKAEIAARQTLSIDSIDPDDTGWQLRFDAGAPVINERGLWRVAAAYKRVGSDAVLDIFTDSDFGLGGTGIEGYILEGEYGVYKNTSVGVNWLSSDTIAPRAPYSVDVLQLNLNVRF